MYLLQPFEGWINWKELLLGDAEWPFLLETVIRTLIMFLILLTGLRLLGKRGVKQLSVFELVVIIGLGSAAGDPMFYKDVGLLPALIVFIMVVSLYLLVTYLVGKNKKFEHLVEGKSVCLIKDGKFSINNFEKELMAQDEFFAELRLQSVSHLGQVEEAIIETSGQISLFFYSDDEVKYGLPIMPGSLENKTNEISTEAHYACIFCGFTERLQPTNIQVCSHCKKTEWVKAVNHKRIN